MRFFARPLIAMLLVAGLSNFGISSFAADVGEKIQENYAWGGPRGRTCIEVVNPVGPSIPTPVDAKYCLHSPLTYFQWYSEGSEKVCTAYTSCGRFYKNVADTYCGHSKDLFSQPLQSKLGYTWKQCERNIYSGATIPFDADGKFIPECAPDTLYSWADEALIDYYIEQVDLNTILPMPRARYFWRTPMGSYGYGEDAIRVKLKKNTQFVLIENIPGFADENRGDCRWLTQHGYDNEHTVYVAKLNQYGRYSEYIVCSPELIHSWSRGSTLFQKEVQDEMSWMATNPNDYDGFASSNGNRSPYEYGFDVGWKKADLLSHLGSLRRKFSARSSQVYFNKGIFPSLWDHFSTQTPGYFNQRFENDHQETPLPAVTREQPDEDYLNDLRKNYPIEICSPLRR